MCSSFRRLGRKRIININIIAISEGKRLKKVKRFFTMAGEGGGGG
jgi:hypothetical protein